MRTNMFYTPLALLVFCFLASPSNAKESCPEENCMAPDRCEILLKDDSISCHQKGTVCCSVVKEEYKTHCRHHGGECMKNCAIELQRQVVDCDAGEVCCILV